MEWDDLRFFLELARARTLTEAARRLEVKHTTVARRIQRLEIALGVPLFLRTSSGYALTRRGKDLVAEALTIEESVRGIREDAPGSSEQISGLVRVGCTEGYGVGIIPPHLGRLKNDYPLIQVDLVVQPRPIQLARNEADIVITIDRPARGPYTITKLGDYELRLYASSDYLKATPEITSPTDLHAHRFVGYVEESEPAKDLPSFSNLVPSALGGIRSTSIFSQIRIVAAGAGLAVLPTFLAEERSDLSPVLREVINFRRTYWMVMSSELNNIPRVRAVWQFLKRAAREDFPRF